MKILEYKEMERFFWRATATRREQEDAAEEEEAGELLVHASGSCENDAQPGPYAAGSASQLISHLIPNGSRTTP